jgi:hypothetical protein
MEALPAHNNNKCYSCGKEFKKPSDLDRHKNRKTPCLIREVPPEHVNNPNRCIFCNKVFSKKENLTKHLKICKVKNGGMDILVDKVRHEQEIRILKEQFNAEIQQLRNEMEELKKSVIVNQPAIQPQIINFNAPVTIIVNNYTNPTINGISITQAELAGADKVSKLLLEKLYFNPDIPENHCMYLKNYKDKSLIVYDEGAWRAILGGNTEEVFKKLTNTLCTVGSNLINGNSGPYISSNEMFTNLPRPDQQKILDFNTFKDILGQDDAYEIFLAGRNIVKSTVKSAGCKFI